MKRAFILLLAALLLVCCGCKELPVPTGQATLDPDATFSPYNQWTPLQFISDQIMSYNFNIKVDAGVIDGRFSLKVTGKAPAGLYFYWEYRYNNVEEISGSGHFHGSSDAFTEHLAGQFEKDSVMRSVYEALFTPLKNADLYSQMVAQYENLKPGETWTSTYNKVTYTHKIGSTEIYGGIEGYEVETYTQEDNLIPIQILCLSPFCVLPTMSLFLTGLDENGNDNYIICELVGITV